MGEKSRDMPVIRDEAQGELLPANGREKQAQGACGEEGGREAALESQRIAGCWQIKAGFRMAGERQRRKQGDERHETKGKRCRQP